MAQLENVAKSFCREQSRDGAFPLDDRIRHQGRCMGDPAGRLDMTSAIRIEGTHTRQNTDGRIGRCRQGLCDVDFPVAFVQQHEIGESTADINAKA